MNSPQKTLLVSDGVKIAFTDCGAGPAVVLLHGMLCHSGHWIFQRNALLDAGYRVVAIDLRFHGGSANPDHGQSIARLGQDVAEVMASENLSNAVLIGHSMGVSVGLAYMALHGTGSLSKFVTIDQSPRIVNDATWPWGVRHVTWDKLEAQIAGRVPWSEFDREPTQPLHVREMLAEVGDIGDFESSPLALRFDHFVSDWRDVLRHIDIPTWVATGEHSPSFPLEGMQWVADTIPDASLTVFAMSGHCPHWNEHERFNRELINFLSR